MRQVFALIMLLVALSVSCAHASEAPVINVERQPVMRADGKPVTMEQLKDAIVRAGTLRGWVIIPDSEGHMVGTINVRNKHLAKVEISYGTDWFSIKYLDSTNLNFHKNEDGIEVIHKNYNRWVNNLRHDIVNTVRALVD